METIPRHYSHYSLSSLHEYIDCASSILNWYKGPTDVNEDSSTSLYFLEWLDVQKGTSHYVEFYKLYNYYEGVNTGRDYLHPELVGDNATAPPKATITYHYFRDIVQQHAIRFKDNTPDQCAKCNTFRADIKNAHEIDRPVLVAAWMAHKVKVEADKGYVNRTAGIAKSKAQWNEVVLPVPNPINGRPFPPVPYLSRPELCDFT
jgi:hypothetical protein